MKEIYLTFDKGDVAFIYLSVTINSFPIHMGWIK